MGENSSSHVGYKHTNWCGNVCLIDHLFTFSLYTFVQINPEKRQKTFKRVVLISQASALVRGQKSLCPRLLRRLASVGSVFLGFYYHHSNPSSRFIWFDRCSCLGGTSLLIIISTGIEGMKQLEGSVCTIHLSARNYRSGELKVKSLNPNVLNRVQRMDKFLQSVRGHLISQTIPMHLEHLKLL